MKKQVRLYNIILPVWLMAAMPSLLWVVVLPANLGVDCLVALLALKALGIARVGPVMRRLWWRLWVRGFLADAAGVVWMLIGGFLPWMAGFHDTPFGRTWENTVAHSATNAFAHPAAFLWVLAGVAISGVCIYFLDRRAARLCPLLDRRQSHKLALAMAVLTAPWLFFIPAY